MKWRSRKLTATKSFKRGFAMKINNVKRLYHGTDQQFDSFDFSRAKMFKDFGKGFYLTTSFSQAQKWAQKKAYRKDRTYIYSYRIASVNADEWNILELLQYNQTWLDFICQSRMKRNETDYDIIYDKMADCQYTEISRVLESYYSGKISSDNALKKIKWTDFSADQYCLKNERALSLLYDRQMITQYKDDKGRWKNLKE